jgi:hypothetical protein
MARQVPVVATLILVGVLWGTATMACQFHGTVVDADTGEPLSDAAVVVVWYKKLRVALPAGDAPWHLHAVKETVTDTSGRFVMSAWRGIDWNPFTYVLVPEIVIYKPGYEPLAPAFATARGFESFEDVEKALRRGKTIRLPRLQSPECNQRARVTGPDDLGTFFVDAPPATIANLLRLIDRQRVRCGMQLLYPHGVQR